MKCSRRLILILCFLSFAASASGGELSRCALATYESQLALDDGAVRLAAIHDEIAQSRAAIHLALADGRTVTRTQWESRKKLLADIYTELGKRAKELVKLRNQAKALNQEATQDRLGQLEREFSDFQIEVSLMGETVDSILKLGPSRALSANELATISSFRAENPTSESEGRLRCSGTISVNGESYPVFEVIASGAEGTAFAGLRDGQIVVIKAYSPRYERLGVDRSVDVANYLRTRGIDTLQIIDSSQDEGRLVSRFVRGYTRADLDTLYRNGQVSPGEYERAKSRFDDLMRKLARIQREPKFRGLLEETLLNHLDTQPRNFIYENSRWVMIDF